jgi:predicted N-acetyltransferase YhbS
MSISTRQEEPSDAIAISEVIRRAYEGVFFSNHREQLMVDRLRASQAYIPQLSLLAEVADEIVGHVLLTRITIRDGETSVPSLALAPLSVTPEFQRQGVGSALVSEAHRRARQLGFKSIIIIGIEGYYQKHGYVPLHLYPIKVPFKVRSENCVILALCSEGLAGISGVIEYAPEWMESPR